MDITTKPDRKYLLTVYGKKGCDKCVTLLSRVKKVLEKNKYKQIELLYHDLSTRQGLVAMAKAETINGQRIPALQIWKNSPEGLVKVRDPRDEKYQGNKLFVPVYLQLETDYSSPELSVIKPAQIEKVLDLALA